MKIRLADIRDADAICLLNDEVQAIHAREFPRIFKPPSDETFPPSEISDLINNEKSVIFVAETNELIVGYLFAEITNYPEISIRYSIDLISIQHISVKESYRKQGVGKLLVDRTLKYAKEKGISIVYTRGGCQNPDLTEVRKNVYLLNKGE